MKKIKKFKFKFIKKTRINVLKKTFNYSFSSMWKLTVGHNGMHPTLILLGWWYQGRCRFTLSDDQWNPMKTPHPCTVLGVKFSLELWMDELGWMILWAKFEPVCGFWIQIIIWFKTWNQCVNAHVEKFSCAVTTLGCHFFFYQISFPNQII
jgi:hypothetical protein